MTRRLALFLLGLLASACATPSSAKPAPAPAPKFSGGYLASVKLADITPPLHLSLFGHGPEGRVATGVRLRLRCEVFVLAQAQSVVALVPCDLQGPSMVLQRAIVDRLAKFGVPIGAASLFLMATHTHAGPAHYFDARRYSGSFSSEAPGYDEKVVSFLADRIAAAVVEAYASLVPACLGWSSRELKGLTFNRSYVPFLKNHDAPTESKSFDLMGQTLQAESSLRTQTQVSYPGQPSAVPQDTAGQLAATGPEVAVDPLLSLLRVYARAPQSATCEGARLVGVFAVFGMHPTGVPNTNELYHSDIFGFAVRAAEGRLSEPASKTRGAEWDSEAAAPTLAGPQVIVGLANGVEGDVSPKLVAQSFPAARRHGLILGDAIAKLAAVSGSNQAACASRKQLAPSASADSLVDAIAPCGSLEPYSWELFFPNGQYADGPGKLLCASAELGVASGAGAPDGPTRLRVIPEVNAGYQLRAPYACHGVKLPLRAGAPSPYDFPQIAPIALIGIAGRVLATAPGEMTSMTGQRIRRGIAARLSGAQRPLVLVGLTNQYLQYFATPEEYNFQYYEGASTLYGPNTEPFLTRHFSRLADRLEGRTNATRPQLEVNVPAEFKASPSPNVKRWPDEESLNTLALEPMDVYPVVRDGAPGWELKVEGLPLTFTSDRALFSVQVLSDDGTLMDDDRGASIEVREVDGDWRIRWVPDLASRKDARCGAWFKLAIKGRVDILSKRFQVKCPDASP